MNIPTHKDQCGLVITKENDKIDCSQCGDPGREGKPWGYSAPMRPLQYPCMITATVVIPKCIECSFSLHPQLISPMIDSVAGHEVGHGINMADVRDPSRFTIMLDNLPVQWYVENGVPHFFDSEDIRVIKLFE